MDTFIIQVSSTGRLYLPIEPGEPEGKIIQRLYGVDLIVRLEPLLNTFYVEARVMGAEELREQADRLEAE